MGHMPAATHPGLAGGVVNADAIRLHTSGVLRARADYHERTKCVTCGGFKPVAAPSSRAFTWCAPCSTLRKSDQQAKKYRRRRRAA